MRSNCTVPRKTYICVPDAREEPSMASVPRLFIPGARIPTSIVHPPRERLCQ